MKIAILTGGTSAERQVSISSADNIRKFLDFAETEIFVLPEDLEDYLNQREDFQITIPMIHGKGGEDGEIQKLLEKLGVPYLFSNVKAHATAIDKKITKEIAEKLGYPVSPGILASKPRFPFFAKPRFGGSSTTAGICQTPEDFSYLLEQTSEEFLLEELLKGREFTVGVIEKNGKLVALPIIEIVLGPNTFFDFEKKYSPRKLAKEICPAKIDEKIAEQMRAAAIGMHKAIGAAHMTRSDFIVTKDNIPYFLEINTIPGMTATSLIPKMLRAAGMDMKELFKEWCQKKITRAL
jgi:D-alanine-D-alanine ligase